MNSGAHGLFSRSRHPTLLVVWIAFKLSLAAAALFLAEDGEAAAIVYERF